MDIKDILLDDETLFRNEEIFNPDYTPEQFSHRDSQIREIARCIKPAMKSGKPLNVLVYGKPATGKTTSIKVIFDQINETTEKIITVHINCQINSSEYSIFSGIHKKIFGYKPPESGLPLSSLYEKIFNKLSKENKSLIVALDDMNFISPTIANKILYDVLRAHESYENVKTSVIISVTKNDLTKLDEKVKTVLQPIEIEFPLYTEDQIHEILKSRVDYGLYPNVMSDRLLKKIVRNTHEKRDLRFGIELIKNLASKAESDASRKIKEIYFTEINKVKENNLEKDEKYIMDALKKYKLDSGTLFKELNKKIKISYSGFYRTIQKMEQTGLVETKTVVKGRGKTRIISLKQT